MITITITNEQEIIYGVDYSDRWAEVITISQEEFSKIQNGLATFDIDTKKVVDLLPPPPPPLPTKEELWELKKNMLVSFFIPMEKREDERYYENVKGKIQKLKNDLYSEIKYRPTEDMTKIEVYNIVLKDVKSFLNKEWYTAYKGMGIEFDKNINELFNS